ncbi:unnamed protein product [Sphagnum balticum]
MGNKRVCSLEVQWFADGLAGVATVCDLCVRTRHTLGSGRIPSTRPLYDHSRLATGAHTQHSAAVRVAGRRRSHPFLISSQLTLVHNTLEEFGAVGTFEQCLSLWTSRHALNMSTVDDGNQQQMYSVLHNRHRVLGAVDCVAGCVRTHPTHDRSELSFETGQHDHSSVQVEWGVADGRAEFGEYRQWVGVDVAAAKQCQTKPSSVDNFG